MNQRLEFQFNVNGARKTIALFIVSSLILVSLLLFTDNNISRSISESKGIYITLVIIFCCIIFKLCRRLVRSFTSKYTISIDNGELKIPTYYLGEKKIEINDIYSVEELSLRNQMVGVTLGVKNAGSYLLDKSRFINPDEFFQLYEYLSLWVYKIVSDDQGSAINLIKNKCKNNKAIFLYVVYIIAVIFFLIGTGGRIEYTENIDFLLIGANSKETIDRFQFYRIASSTFLHISIFHLLLNLLILAIFSQFLETLLSFVRFTNLFLLSSAIAVLLSAWFSKFDASIGASGGMFGLWGAYAVLKIKYEDWLPGSVNSIPTKKFYLILFFEIFIEVFIVENVDYINHLGGFIAGFAYLYFAPLGPRLEYVDQPTVFEKTLFGFLVLLYSVGLTYFLLLYYQLI